MHLQHKGVKMHNTKSPYQAIFLLHLPPLLAQGAQGEVVCMRRVETGLSAQGMG